MITRGQQRFSHQRAAPAYALLEAVIAVGLFSIFAVVATRLVASSLRISNEVSRAEQLHRSFDSALARLRADVWAATRIEVRGPAGVTLELGGDRGSVTWNVGADGPLARTESTGGYPTRQHWPTAGEHVVFRAEAGMLVLDVPKRRGFDNGTYRLYSQILLAEGAR